MLTFTAGDTAAPLRGTVNANLTGATAKVHIVQPDRTVLQRTPAITDMATGRWELDWQTGDLTQTGVYTVEVEVTYSDGAVQTFAFAEPRFMTPAQFYVREQYA